jgi:hypothetical protein
MQEHYAEVVFELPDDARDGGGAEQAGACRTNQAAAVRNLDEDFQRTHPVHAQTLFQILEL